MAITRSIGKGRTMTSGTGMKKLAIVLVIFCLVSSCLARELTAGRTHHRSQHKLPWWQILLIVLAAIVSVGILMYAFYWFGCCFTRFKKRGLGPEVR